MSTSLALACRLGAGSPVPSIPRRVRSILLKYGATLLMPGPAVPILGPELIAGGSFDSAAGWTLGANTAISGGILTISGATTISSYAAPVNPAAQYLVAFQIAAQTNAGTGVRVRPGGTVAGTYRTAMGSYSEVVTATASGTSFNIDANATGWQGSIDNVSVREIVGYQNTYASFAAGNYKESTGNTLAGIDQQVGLVIDASQDAGPELMSNGDFAAGLTAWTVYANGGTAEATGGVATVTSGGTNGRIEQAKTLTANKTYIATAYVTLGTAPNMQLECIRGAAGSYASLGKFVATTPGRQLARFVFVATGADVIVQAKSANGAGTFTIEKVSLRELPGIHASQSTSGYQPVLRRGLVNLLTYSNDFGNGVWSKIGTTSSSGRLVESSETNTHQTRQSYTLVTGSKYSIAARVRPDQRTVVYVASYDGVKDYGVSFDLTTGTYSGIRTSANALAPSSYSIASDTDGYYVIVMNFTSQGVGGGYTSQVGILNASGDWPTNAYTGDGTSGIYLHSAALFQGTVTAEEIIAAGGIPVTTSAPASSANGIQSWQFDGTDDRLSLSAVPFQMSDDHFVVAGFRNDSKAALRAQFSVSGSDQTRIAQVYTHTNGGVRVVWRDGSGAVQNEVVSSVDVTGTAVIASGAKRLGRLIGRLDGAQFGDIASGAFGASNPIAASVGANTGVLGFFANGHIHGVIFGKGAITDAELLVLEKFAAKLQGRSL